MTDSDASGPGTESDGAADGSEPETDDRGGPEADIDPDADRPGARADGDFFPDGTFNDWVGLRVEEYSDGEVVLAVDYEGFKRNPGEEAGCHRHGHLQRRRPVARGPGLLSPPGAGAFVGESPER